MFTSEYYFLRIKLQEKTRNSLPQFEVFANYESFILNFFA